MSKETKTISIGSLFSGIGGLELGLEWAGLGPVRWQVESDAFCRKLLRRHWPTTKLFEDVRNVEAKTLQPVDLICGGFPCQDVSTASPRGHGLAGARSGLWFEFARIVRAMRPDWVVVENTAGATKRWVEPVRGSLRQLGYASIPIPLEARYVGAPHRRGRVFLVAHTDSEALRFKQQREPTRSSDRVPNRQETVAVDDGPKARWTTEPSLHRVDDGAPSGVDMDARRAVDAERVRVLGNAVVPQCAEIVGRVIGYLAGRC